MIINELQFYIYFLIVVIHMQQIFPFITIVKRTASWHYVTLLCSLSTVCLQGSFCLASLTLWTHEMVTPQPSLPAAPGNHHSTQCFCELGALGSSCKWNAVVSDLLRLAYFM